MGNNIDFYNFFPSMEESNEVYFGSEAPLAKHLKLYSSQLKQLVSGIKDFKKKDFLSKLNKIVQNFNRDIAKDLNCERVQLSVINDLTDNACAFLLFWNANMTSESRSGYKLVDFDKIADLEDIVITKEGYKYRDPKGKILLIVLNIGCIQKASEEEIAGTLAHEVGHCFQDGIFGVYKDIADMTLTSQIEYAMSSAPILTNGSFGQTFIILLYWLFLPLNFISNLTRLALLPAFAFKWKKFNEEKTVLMKDELKKLDDGNNEIKTDLGAQDINTSIYYISKDKGKKDEIVTEISDRDKKELEHNYEKLKKEITKEKEEKVRIKKRNAFLNFFRSIFANINAASANVLRVISLSDYTANEYAKLSFTKKYEFFADIFASSYGFAPSLYKNLVKMNNDLIKNILGKDLVGMNDPSLLKMGYMNKQWRLIKKTLNNDVHGTWIQRGTAMYTALSNELKNNTSLTTSQRKEIETHLNSLQKADEIYYKDQKENSGFWTKFYESVINDKINGKDRVTEEQILEPIQRIAQECINKK